MFVKLLRGILLASLAVAGLAACTSAATPAPTAATPHVEADPEAPTTGAPATGALSGDLIIYSGRSEALIKPLIEEFSKLHPNIKIALKSGSNSELANALIEEKANPQADLFLTTELMTVQKMADEGVFQPYEHAAAQAVPAAYRHPQGLWIGLTLRGRVIMYNTELVKPEDAPKSILELTDPKWKGQIAAAGSTNGGMQAQVGAMRQLIGEEKTQAWLDGLKANDVTFFGGHTDVRKAVGAGEFKIGLVNHYYFYLQQAEKSPVGVVFPDQGEGQLGLIVNATAIGVVKGTKHKEAAEAFIDFLLSADGQADFAKLNYEYPLRENAALHPEVQPLTNYHLAQFDVVKAAQSLNSTLDMLEKAGIP